MLLAFINIRNSNRLEHNHDMSIFVVPRLSTMKVCKCSLISEYLPIMVISGYMMDTSANITDHVLQSCTLNVYNVVFETNCHKWTYQVCALKLPL